MPRSSTRSHSVHGVGGGAEELAPALARVAGPADDATGCRAPRPRGTRTARRPCRAAPAPRGPCTASIAHSADTSRASSSTAASLSHVRRVDDEQVAVLAPVGDQVVDHPAALVRQQRVLRAPRGDLVEVVREPALQVGKRLGTENFELAHMRHVEHARAPAHGQMLLGDRGELHWQLPPGERDEARAGFSVSHMERRPAERLHRAMILATGTRGRACRRDRAVRRVLTTRPTRLALVRSGW